MWRLRARRCRRGAAGYGLGDGLRLTLRWVAEAVGGRIRSGDPDLEIGNVVIDTRTLQQGDFFIALRGPRFDAHEFVVEAFVSVKLNS